MFLTQIQAPDGSLFERHVIRHPGAVAIVPITDRESVLLVRQYRAPVDQLVLEIPAGTIDVDGESPEQTAKRELAEEIGMVAGALEPLAQVLNTPGFCDEKTWLYLATDLISCSISRSGIEEKLMEIVEVPLHQIDEMIRSGLLIDAQTIIGLYLARQLLSTRT